MFSSGGKVDQGKRNKKKWEREVKKRRKGKKKEMGGESSTWGIHPNGVEREGGSSSGKNK